MSLRIFLIGGHGKVALYFTRLALERGHTIVSQLRQEAHIADLPKSSSNGKGKVEPLLSSLEELNASYLSTLFEKHQPNVIVFAAGAGGKGGQERTFGVDRDGAIRVFDAIEGWKGRENVLNRFLLVSAVDVRDVEKTKPDWYSEEDLATSKRMRVSLAAYMQAKYEADRNLSNRNTFPWTVLRPSLLQDDAGTSKVSLAQQKTISKSVPREDVAHTLLCLAELPKGEASKGADGMMWDLTRGEGDVKAEVDEAVRRARTDWVG